MKRQYNLYLDIEAIEILKGQGWDNFSAFCNALLRQEAALTNNEDDPMSTLKIANAKLIAELEKTKKENRLLIKQIKEMPEKKESKPIAEFYS